VEPICNFIVDMGIPFDHQYWKLGLVLKGIGCIMRTIVGLYLKNEKKCSTYGFYLLYDQWKLQHYMQTVILVED